MLFALSLVGVSAAALFAGWLYGRTNPEGAGARLVSDLVIREPEGSGDGDPAAPTSGTGRGTAACGVRSERVDRGTQLATLSAGAVIIQFRPDALDRQERAAVADLADEGHPVLVAPNPDLGSAVAATAWTRRMPLETASPELLRAFAMAYGEESACDT